MPVKFRNKINIRFHINISYIQVLIYYNFVKSLTSFIVKFGEISFLWLMNKNLHISQGFPNLRCIK